MIHYERVKTGRPVSVFANGDLLKIIEKYRTDSCYIWPVLSDGASEEAIINVIGVPYAHSIVI